MTICERDKDTIAVLEPLFIEVSIHGIAGVSAWLPMGYVTTMAGGRTAQQMRKHAAVSQHCGLLLPLRHESVVKPAASSILTGSLASCYR